MGLDIADAECLAWMQQQQSDGPTIIVLFILLVITSLTALCENTMKNV